MAAEFDLIQRYFSHIGASRADVILGVGDDCALLQIPEGQQLAVSIDTLVEGVHFVAGSDPESLGHKALAVNLSDLAAMGAQPAWATLALTLPASDTDWLTAFSHGFATLARQTGVQLVGGDTTRGPLSISIQVHGFIAIGEALRRSGAAPGELIAVTGGLGDAGLALQQQLAGVPRNPLWQRLERPLPRLAAGQALVGVARAAIDISDGLVADLGHICRASGVGASLELSRLPLSPAVREQVQSSGDWSLPLSAGDDYELCVTVPAADWEAAVRQVTAAGDVLTPIGVIETEPGIRCRTAAGGLVQPLEDGYQHFTGQVGRI